MGKADQVAFEFDRAVPGLKGKRGTPHEPEIGLEKRCMKVPGDAGSSQKPFRLKQQPFEGEDVVLGEAEAGRIDAAAGAGRAVTWRRSSWFRSRRRFPGSRSCAHRAWGSRKRDRKCRGTCFRASAAAHDVAVFRVSGGVEAAADLCGLLDDGDVVSWDMAIANEEGGSGKRSDATAYQVHFRFRIGTRSAMRLAFRLLVGALLVGTSKIIPCLKDDMTGR